MMQTLNELNKHGGISGFDSWDNYSGDRSIAHWFILLSQNRDSRVLEQSNFASALEELGGESDTVQVHRFGHWGCGWYELILIDPTDVEAVRIGEDIERALEDYPVLDENDFLERELEDELESWQAYGEKEFTKWLVHEWLSDCPEEQYYDLECDLDEALCNLDSSTLYEIYRECKGETIHESDGCYFDLRYASAIDMEDAIPDYIAQVKQERMAKLRMTGDFLGDKARWFWNSEVDFCLWEDENE